MTQKHDSSITLTQADCTDELTSLPDESVQLTVTSPPYNIGIDYGEESDDCVSLDTWRQMMEDVFEELFRVTKPDGKVAINIGYSYGDTETNGRYFRVPLLMHVLQIAQDVGFDMYDAYVWVKNSFASHGGGPLFGSYPDPTNFMANQMHEHVLIFRKWVSEEYYSERELPSKGTAKRERSQLSKDEWRTYTKSVWDFSPASPDDVDVDHDAMYPTELPKRLIRLYSFVGDTVLDPFLGTGTTAVAAKEWERDCIGIEVNEQYLETAERRVQRATSQLPETITGDSALDSSMSSSSQQQLTEIDY